MRGVTRLILWRHGQTDWNLAQRFQGQTDIPLNDAGLAQAQAAAPYLAALHPDAIVSSPLQRALTTADALAQIVDLAVTSDERLEEINVGSWAGLTVPEVYADPQLAQARRDGADYQYSATGERRSDVGVRVCLALRDIAASHPGQTVVVVSHGVAIRMGVTALCNLDIPPAGSLPNCSWTIVAPHKGLWRIQEWGVTAHDAPDRDRMDKSSM